MAASLTRDKPVFNGMFQLDGGLEFRHVDILLVPRLRIDDFTDVQKSTSLFFQQAFVSLKGENMALKIGKVLGQFGRIWDYGLYGPLLANTDVKLTPDLGLSLEASHDLRGTFKLFWAAQFFVADGKALSTGNAEFFTWKYARRRNITAVRVQPSIALADGRLSVAVSGQHFQSVRKHMAHVWRTAVDIDFSRQGFDAFVEVGHQFGKDVPSTDRDEIGSHGYVWAGAQKAIGPVLLRHHVNLVLYPSDGTVLDVLHQPGAEWLVASNFSLIAEAAFWHNAPNVRGRGERTLFVVALGKF